MRERWGSTPSYISVPNLQRGLTRLGKAAKNLVKDPRASFSKPKHLRDSVGESWRREAAGRAQSAQLGGRSVPHQGVSRRSSARGALNLC
jgi:hypothetical protein